MREDAPPDSIRLTDLAEPAFTPEQRALLDSAEDFGRALEFDLDTLRSAAIARSDGLDDFGSDLYLEPYEVLCDALEREADLSGMGRASVHAQLVQFLVNRLRLTELMARHPDIDEVDVSRPVVIAGMPRSGTTHLHNLMSQDSRLRSLPWWEAIEPVPSADEWGTVDGRIERAQAGLDIRDDLMPHFNRMHEMTWDHVHEEIHLLAIAGSSMFFDTLAYVPSWRDWFVATDQTPYYLELRQMLKVLTWLRGPSRWVLKSPQHLEQFAPLVTAFPDATFVVTHRDPVSITASMATMMAYTARIAVAAPIDVDRIARWWATYVADFLSACVRDRRLLPAARSIDVRFADFMADDIGTIRRIYETADLPLDERTRAAMDSYMADHPRGRFGRIEYSFEDLGLDLEELRASLAFYVDAFGVEWER